MARCPRRRARSRCYRRCAPRLAGRRRRRRPGRLRGTINVVLPVPGDVRGLAAGTQFERDALAAGEAVIITNPDDPGAAVGLVPEFSYSDLEEAAAEEADPPELSALSWIVYSLPGAPAFDHHELGDAEYTLRSAVRSAADALGAIGLGSAASDIDDPRGLVEQLLESARQHRIPDHAPSRALRVLENAAHVDAIIAVSAGLTLRSIARIRPGTARNHPRKPGSPTMRCGRLPRWCARRGWPRSAQSCTRPGPTSNSGRPLPRRSAVRRTARLRR